MLTRSGIKIEGLILEKIMACIVSGFKLMLLNIMDQNNGHKKIKDILKVSPCARQTVDFR